MFVFHSYAALALGIQQKELDDLLSLTGCGETRL